MEGEHVVARRWILVLALVALAPATRAQSTRQKGKDAKSLLVVPALTSPDKMLGYQAAVEIRTHIDDDADTRQLWVVPQDNIDETLLASDFPPHDAISDMDAKILATQLRADFYLEGTATHVGNDVLLTTKLVLNQNTGQGSALSQPLPPAQANKVSKAADLVSRAFEEALKPLALVAKCSDEAHKNDIPGALAAAHQAILIYPRSTLARLCIATIYHESNQPADSILSISREILALDPRNRLALNYAAEAAYEKKDLDAAGQYWSQLLAADPSNTALVEDVVNKIVTAGRLEAALPIIDTAVDANPNDAKLLGLKYKLLIRAGKWADAIPVGDSVIREDTSFADTLYYQRQTTAYQSDSEPQRSAEIAAQGLSKFPGNLTLEEMETTALAQSGQTQHEAAELHKFLATNPKDLIFWHLLYNAFVSTNQPDSALWVLRQTAVNGDSASVVARYALGQGAKFYKAGNLNKNRDTLEIAIQYLTFSDSLAPAAGAKFLLGASQAVIGSNEVTDAFKNKDCAQLHDVQELWTAADTNLHAGGSFSPDGAAAYLKYIDQYLPSVNAMIKKSCK